MIATLDTVETVTSAVLAFFALLALVTVIRIVLNREAAAWRGLRVGFYVERDRDRDPGANKEGRPPETDPQSSTPES